MMAFAVERFVGDQRVEGQSLDERRHADRVEAMGGQENEADEIAKRVGERQDFGGHAAFRTDRWPGSESPFCALSVAVHLDDGGVDYGVFHVGIVGDGAAEGLDHIRFCCAWPSWS